jgi:uracil-DNA glycosylase
LNSGSFAFILGFFVFRDLSPLAEQGVLWLNACLTVRAHKANSHSKKGWEIFTAEVLRAVVNRGKKEGNDKGVVFLLWGLPAQKTGKTIGINEVGISVVSPYFNR